MTSNLGSERGTRYIGCCNSESAVTLFVPLSRRGRFCSNLVPAAYRLVDGGNLDPSIHPAPDIEGKKLCVRVVRTALPMIDISREDGMKGREGIWRWGAVE